MKSKDSFRNDLIKVAIFFICVFAVSLPFLLSEFVPSELQDQNVTTEPADVVATTTVGNKPI